MLIYGNKNDDRLHILIPVPVLTRILRKEAAEISVPDISQVLLGSPFFAAASSAYAAQTTTAIKAAGHTMSLKLITAITAGAITAGAVTASIVLTNKSPQDSSETQASHTDAQYDIRQLSAVVKSISNRPIAEAKQTLYESFGIPADQWETEQSGSVTYHTGKIPGGIWLSHNEFDSIVLVEKDGSGVVYNKGETVLIYKVYDSYNDAAAAKALLTDHLSAELGADSNDHSSSWTTDSGKVSVSISASSDGKTGILTLCFKEE